MIRRDESAIVSGASGYLGVALSQALRSRDVEVVGVDIKPSSTPEIFVEFHLTELGGREPSAVAIERPVNHVFHMAGGALRDEIETSGLSTSHDLIDRTMRWNFHSAIDLIEIATRFHSKPSTITLASSINALGDFGLPIYSSSKAALHGLVKSRAADFEKRGTRLNAVALGTVLHPGVEALHASEPNYFDHMRDLTNTGELLTPDLVADEFIRIALDSEISGEVVVFDNGQLSNRTEP